MRKVQFKDYDSEKKEWVESEGNFHQWGCSFDQDSNGAPYTFAIVEDANGKVWEVSPHHLNFLPEQELKGEISGH